ncbi:F-box/kelch-repeat protein At3g23880-like [Andrographis paniculata]|uniref:F-box/kelch-repeat protein At3g23880-like n=1 Tax=Andrographis paniculata TaxID=175694 RepID=UPI0021E7AF39|nr:F-box/kelch-repeat protein At3g23880-like [Andrographis paniculata]
MSGRRRRRSSISFSAGGSLPLPEEVLAEILARLPVKSLLRFRCVSKSWRSLISSPHFIAAHLSLSLSLSLSCPRHHLISTILLPSYTLKHCPLPPLLSGHPAAAVDFDYPMKSPNNSVRVVGSCNGLVCIAVNGRHFFLWNPSTRMSRKLPDADDRIKNGLFVTKYGFGFDGRDYKVVGILSGFCDSGRSYETMVKVYSLNTNSWTRIDAAFDEGLPFDDVGKFVNGSLHWGRRVGFDSRWDIVSFDLARESSGIVAQPRYVEGGFLPSLGVLMNCLCVVCDFPKISAEVWMMRKYGVRDSWEKVVSIPYMADPWTPLWLGSSGEVLMAYGSCFMVYDPVDGRFVSPTIANFGTFLEANVYVESLVSLAPA